MDIRAALLHGLPVLRDASSYSSTRASGTAYRGRDDAVVARGEGGGAGVGGPCSFVLRGCSGRLGLVRRQHCRCKTPAVADRDSLLTSPLADHGRGCI
jgi:hypothetical protein